MSSKPSQSEHSLKEKKREPSIINIYSDKSNADLESVGQSSRNNKIRISEYTDDMSDQSKLLVV
jgi:hypothetical protein